MKELLKSFWTDESGQGLAEYAVLLGLITLAVILIIVTLGEHIANVFSRVTNLLGTHVDT